MGPILPILGEADGRGRPALRTAETLAYLLKLALRGFRHIVLDESPQGLCCDGSVELEHKLLRKAEFILRVHRYEGRIHRDTVDSRSLQMLLHQRFITRRGPGDHDVIPITVKGSGRLRKHHVDLPAAGHIGLAPAELLSCLLRGNPEPSGGGPTRTVVHVELQAKALALAHRVVHQVIPLLGSIIHGALLHYVDVEGLDTSDTGGSHGLQVSRDAFL